MSAQSRRRDGQALVEYAVIVTFIAVVSLAAVGYLRGQTNAMFIAHGQALGAPTVSAGNVAYVPPATATATATATTAVQPTVALASVTGTIVGGPPPTGSVPELAIVVPPTATVAVVATIPPTATVTSIPATFTATATATATPLPTPVPTPGSIP